MVLERHLNNRDWLFSDQAFAVNANYRWWVLALHQNSLTQGLDLSIGFNKRVLLASRSGLILHLLKRLRNDLIDDLAGMRLLL